MRRKTTKLLVERVDAPTPREEMSLEMALELLSEHIRRKENAPLTVFLPSDALRAFEVEEAFNVALKRLPVLKKAYLEGVVPQIERHRALVAEWDALHGGPEE